MPPISNLTSSNATNILNNGNIKYLIDGKRNPKRGEHNEQYRR